MLHLHSLQHAELTMLNKLSNIYGLATEYPFLTDQAAADKNPSETMHNQSHEAADISNMILRKGSLATFNRFGTRAKHANPLARFLLVMKSLASCTDFITGCPSL